MPAPATALTEPVRCRFGFGVPIYATDGVENNALAEGLVVHRTLIERSHRVQRHLNPQTMEKLSARSRGPAPSGAARVRWEEAVKRGDVVKKRV